MGLLAMDQAFLNLIKYFLFGVRRYIVETM